VLFVLLHGLVYCVTMRVIARARVFTDVRLTPGTLQTSIQ